MINFNKVRNALLSPFCNYITFFHNSDYDYEAFPALFKPMQRRENRKKPTRPVFYWFSNSWHSNFPNIRNKYFYLFVKNPKLDNFKLRSRHSGLDFNGLYSFYEKYLEKRKLLDLEKLYKDFKGGYYEPSILMSFSEVVPDLVVTFPNDKDTRGIILKPKKLEGEKIDLLTKNYRPLNFIDIPEIVSAVPKIKRSYPFIQPKKIDGRYYYKDWLPMPGKAGFWL